MKQSLSISRPSDGYLLVLVLIFSSVLFVMISSFMGFVIGQSQVITLNYEKQRAADIAEAGLNYYRWYLAHYPNDTTDGTGLPGPYVHQYFDPEGSAIGEYSLAVSSTTYCGDVSSIHVASTAFTYAKPNVKRIISARYIRPTVADYAYIINSNVWAGADRTIIGPYHSNGGIRMDGSNQSTVTSGQSTWSCNSSFGCVGTQIRDGVFTTTGNSKPTLFNFPSAPINFTGLSLDLVKMKQKAQTGGGIYIGPASSNGGGFGYQVTFNANNTINLKRVTKVDSYYSLTTENSWQTESNVINTTRDPQDITIPASCPLIFVEDNVWLSGTTSMKVTLAAANTITPNTDASIILNGDIAYATSAAGVLAIGEEDVLIGLKVPDNMFLNGIFVAQNGKYGRNHYCSDTAAPTCSTYKLPSNLAPYRFRSSLTLNGTIVSNGRVGDKWTAGNTWTSGFNTRTNTYDRDLVENPPPLVPNTSDVYVFRDWREAQ